MSFNELATFVLQFSRDLTEWGAVLPRSSSNFSASSGKKGNDIVTMMD